MTGFGRAAVDVEGRRLLVEIRAVNHRGLDVKVRARDLDAACEIEIVKAVRGALERGAVVVSVDVHDATTGPVGLGVPVARVRALHAALEAVRSDLGVDAPVDLATIAAFLSLGNAGAAGGGFEDDGAWPVLGPAVHEALRSLRDMRVREGRALATDIDGRITTLRRLAERLRSLCAGLPTRAARKLEERVAALTADTSLAEVPAARLAQEIALLAERLDVSEELVRLSTHLDHLASLTSAGEAAAVGRKMDFVVQEIGRELNTLGSKAQDADVAAAVIEAKAELEKIREQGQNVE